MSSVARIGPSLRIERAYGLRTDTILIRFLSQFSVRLKLEYGSGLFLLLRRKADGMQIPSRGQTGTEPSPRTWGQRWGSRHIGLGLGFIRTRHDPTRLAPPPPGRRISAAVSLSARRVGFRGRACAGRPGRRPVLTPEDVRGSARRARGVPFRAGNVAARAPGRCVQQDVGHGAADPTGAADRGRAHVPGRF